MTKSSTTVKKFTVQAKLTSESLRQNNTKTATCSNDNFLGNFFGKIFIKLRLFPDL
jgi:hypothetical protein